MWITVFTFAVTIALACGVAAVFLQSDSRPGNGDGSFFGDSGRQ